MRIWDKIDILKVVKLWLWIWWTDSWYLNEISVTEASWLVNKTHFKFADLAWTWPSVERNGTQYWCVRIFKILVSIGWTVKRKPGTKLFQVFEKKFLKISSVVWEKVVQSTCISKILSIIYKHSKYQTYKILHISPGHVSWSSAKVTMIRCRARQKKKKKAKRKNRHTNEFFCRDP